MVGDPAPARLIGSVLAGGAASAFAYGTPRISGALDPSLGDVLVGGALAGVAVFVADRRRVIPSTLMGLAALAWLLVGVAVVVTGPIGDALLRLAIMPDAFVAAAYTTLPTGRVRGPRAAVLIAVSLTAGAVAGTGLVPAPLLPIGVVALVAAFPIRKATTPVGIVLGLLFMTEGVAAVTGAAPAVLSAAVDIGLIAAAVAFPLVVDHENRIWRAAIDADDDLLGTRLGAALHTGPLRISVPVGDGSFVDLAGRTLPSGSQGRGSLYAASDLIAVIEPAVPIDPMLADAFTRLVGHLAQLARARHRQRALADALAESRALLLQAADAERRDLTARLRTVVGGSIDAVVADLTTLPDQAALLERAIEAGRSVLRFDEVPSMIDAAAIRAALSSASGTDVQVMVGLRTVPHRSVAAAIWFTCSEAVANATKHAPGSRVEVSIVSDAASVVVAVRDSGPGGADASGPGLRGLADRAAALGGRVRVESTDTGTAVTLTIPAASRGPAKTPTSIRGSADVSARATEIPSVS